MLIKGKLNSIKYHKSLTDITDRIIIPTSIPETVIRALDVSDLTPDQKHELETVYQSYMDYLEVRKSQTMKLEDFITLVSKFDTSLLKYRSFTPGKIETTPQ